MSLATAVRAYAHPGWQPTGEARGSPHQREDSAVPEGVGMKRAVCRGDGLGAREGAW